MAVNKVEANGETLIDLTDDTVTADTLLSGRTAHLASGAQVTGTFEPVTGVKGNAESAYRKGNVNLTPANIGAATSEQGAKADSAVQTIQISGTTQTKTGGTVNLPAYPTKSSLGLGNVDNTSDANKPISTAAQTALNNKADKNGNNITDPTAFRKAIGTGNQVTLTGAVTGTGTFDSNGNIVSVSTTLNSELSGQINYNTNNGVKNLLYTAPITYTECGITISRISPNKYSVSGTTTLSGSTCLMITNLSTAAISADNSQYPASGEYAPGAYIASVYGIPAGLNVQIIAATSVPISGSNYRLLYLNSANPALKFTLAANEKYLWFRIAYDVTSVTTFNDEFEIMLRSATIEDSTFVPYAMSNVELTQKALIPKVDNNHNGIFRGKDLTNVYTIDQMYSMIHSGNFDDLFLGDYFTKSMTTDIYTRFTGASFTSGTVYYEMGGTITNRTWTATTDTTPQTGKVYATKTTKTENVALMFAAFDYYYNVGDTALTTHHAVLIPRGYGFATTAQMNSSNTTVGSYFYSDMHQIVLPCYAKSLKTVLNNHLLAHRTILPNAINASTPSMAGAGMTGASNKWTWETVELQLMSEPQIYGTTVWSSSAYDVGADYKKLPVFDFINGAHFDRFHYWLRSVVSSSDFAYCSINGYASNYGASGAFCVRPLILFG